MSYDDFRGRSKERATADATAEEGAEAPPAPRKRRINRGPKPAKPYPEYPLYAHAGGVWAKQIRGREYYFGPWSDPDGALERYLKQRDFLHAGVAPPLSCDGLTVDELVNRFLDYKLSQVELGEVSRYQYNCYRCDAKLVLNCLGRTRPAATLTPGDFRKLRTAVATRYRQPQGDGDGAGATPPALRSPSTISGMIVRIRTMFRWAHQVAHLLERPMDYGGEFNRPTAASVRISLSRRPPKDFSAAEVHRLLQAANVPMRAMILLGINCGFGNTDASRLEWSDIELTTKRGKAVGGWHNLPRSKTGVYRRAPLWKETVDALLQVKAMRAEMDRRQAPPPELANRVFITLKRMAYVHLSPVDGTRGGRSVDSVRLEFARLMRDCGLTPRRKKGEPRRPACRGFYALRHTFRTVADETGDFPAVDVFMGHTAESAGAGAAPFSVDMASRYRRIADDRLLAVSEHVRGWLYGKPTRGRTKSAKR